MFESLSDKIANVFEKLRSKGVITDEDLALTLREIRVALLEADVALPVVKKFTAEIKEKALGEKVVASVSPAQMIIKIVQDELVNLLRAEEGGALNLNVPAPAVILLCGLQGSGKTTSCNKLALLLGKEGKKVLMASLDVYRPAAMQQLAQLGKQSSIDTLEIIEKQAPKEITKRALREGKLGGYDVIILDTAGRGHLDDALMDELAEVQKIATPVETLLVADSLTGQDAVNVAQGFANAIGISGVILTRIDGDARGGAALSMKEQINVPIKFIGVGETPSAFQLFDPKRAAERILGMGDVVGLVEKAAEFVDQNEAEALAKKAKKGKIDFNDLLKQLSMVEKMGGASSLMSMIPGVGKVKKQIEAAGGMDNKAIARQKAIIQSMTLSERAKPELLNASRKRRIAMGAGASIQQVNQLIKQFKQMQTMMKKFGGMSKKGLMQKAKMLGIN